MDSRGSLAVAALQTLSWDFPLFPMIGWVCSRREINGGEGPWASPLTCIHALA